MKISTCICEIVFSVEVLPPVKGSDIDVTPVQKFLSREYLGDLRWQAGDGGAIYEGKDRLTPVGFVPALEKLIALAMGQGGSKSVECLRLRTDLSPNAAVEDPEIPSDNLLNLVSCAGGDPD
jgi:hypothetical protein